MGILAEYYRDVDILARMQLDERGYFWARGRPEQQHADTVVYLGCNVLRTLHLALEVVRLVEAVEGNPSRVVTLGGPGHCCGSTHAELLNDPGGAAKRGGRTVDTFRELGAKTLVQWCPVCERRFGSYEAIDLAAEDYESLHATEYLARHVRKLPLTPTPVPLRVAVHEHTGDAASERDVADAKRALSQIDGVEVVPGGAFGGFSYQCFTHAEHPSQSFLRSLDASIAEAETNRADMIVSVYHSCHRALVRSSRRYGLPSLNFLDIIAERAGLRVPDRYRQFIELGDEDQIWRAVAERFRPDEQEDVRRVIRQSLIVEGDPSLHPLTASRRV